MITSLSQPNTSLFHTYTPHRRCSAYIFTGLAQSRGTIYSQRLHRATRRVMQSCSTHDAEQLDRWYRDARCVICVTRLDAHAHHVTEAELNAQTRHITETELEAYTQSNHLFLLLFPKFSLHISTNFLKTFTFSYFLDSSTLDFVFEFYSISYPLK